MTLFGTLPRKSTMAYGSLPFKCFTMSCARWCDKKIVVLVHGRMSRSRCLDLLLLLLSSPRLHMPGPSALPFLLREVGWHRASADCLKGSGAHGKPCRRKICNETAWCRECSGVDHLEVRRRQSLLPTPLVVLVGGHTTPLALGVLTVCQPLRRQYTTD